MPTCSNDMFSLHDALPIYDALEGQGVVEGPGGRGVLQRPAVDAEVVLGSVDQLDEVVLENGTGVAHAAIDLLDLEVTGLDDGGLRHRCQAGRGRQPQGEGRCGDAEAGGALPAGGTDRGWAHGGTLLEVRGARVGRWEEGGGRGREAGGPGLGSRVGRPAGRAWEAGVRRPAGRAWEAGVGRPGRWPRGTNALSRAGWAPSDAALVQGPTFPTAPRRDGCTGCGR